MALLDIRPALRAFLLADGFIAATVGTRVYPDRLPAGPPAGPSIVYNMISEVSQITNSGPDWFVAARYQIDAWASSGDAAHSLSLLIKERLDGFRGTMGAVVVRGVFAEAARPDYEASTNLSGISREFLISYAEQ